ncbi:hypothetical protein [Sansalvadorimonas verongulae]|uniref:hypothetical protein n=1 Tax=Sansalvadorimonas verongulae TaxID=2172824 RepID=UPI0012BC1A5F|nr:hypothetical protein [Sansalvadorimonas verongulae]MTI15135.1 hypothetical protein [Sansalvadorimonas verongulae]
MPTPRQKNRLQDALMTKRARIDELLALVQTQADSHFNCGPEHCHWGHAGDLDHLIACLENALGIERQ